MRGNVQQTDWPCGWCIRWPIWCWWGENVASVEPPPHTPCTSPCSGSFHGAPAKRDWKLMAQCWPLIQHNWPCAIALCLIHYPEQCEPAPAPTSLPAHSPNTLQPSLNHLWPQLGRDCHRQPELGVCTPWHCHLYRGIQGGNTAGGGGGAYTGRAVWLACMPGHTHGSLGQLHLETTLSAHCCGHVQGLQMRTHSVVEHDQRIDLRT